MSTSSTPHTILALLATLCLVACTGSAETLALKPAFEVTTLAGPASVSVRESLPGMPDLEFEQLLTLGMENALRVTAAEQNLQAPYPQRRIVWHVIPAPGRGESRLVANIFDGSVAVASQQETVADSASKAMITHKICMMSRRLIDLYAHRTVRASA
jgi:hypothetical protein